MKKLYKKIGAVALASMIVAGGVGARKIDSHALWGNSRSSVIISRSDWDLNKLSGIVKQDCDYIEDFIKHEKGDRKIELIAASGDEHALNEYIKREYANQKEVKDRLLSEVAAKCFYGRQFIAILDSEKKVNHNIVKIKFGEAFILVSIQ